MLRALRFRLTLLYLAASLGLVALLGAGTYGLLTLYFQRSTDLALQYKMAAEFRLRGLSLLPELAAAEQTWMENNGQQNGSSPTLTPFPSGYGASEEEGESEHGYIQTPAGQSASGDEGDDRYDGSLAPVFVVPDVGSTPADGAPSVNDPAANSAALQTGSDLRTVCLDDGSRLRLLTYRIGSGSVLQVGRLLNDQDRLLSQYLTGLLLLGSAASLILALASWGLAGR